MPIDGVRRGHRDGSRQQKWGPAQPVERKRADSNPRLTLALRQKVRVTRPLQASVSSSVRREVAIALGFAKMECDKPRNTPGADGHSTGVTRRYRSWERHSNDKNMCIYLYPATSFLVGRSVFPCANSHPLRRRGPPSRKTPPNTPRSTGRSLVIIWAPCIWKAVIPPSFLRTPTVRRCRSLDWQPFFSCPLDSRVSDEKCAVFLLSVPLGQCVSSHRLLLVFSSSRGRAVWSLCALPQFPSRFLRPGLVDHPLSGG